MRIRFPLAAAVAALRGPLPRLTRQIRSCRCGRSMPACSARLLGDPGHGHQLVQRARARRRRRGGHERRWVGFLSRRPGRRSTRPGSAPGSRARRSTARTRPRSARDRARSPESINEYGGKVALATPIEAIIGTPVDVPGRPSVATPTTPGASRATANWRAAFERKRPSARMRAAMANAKPLAAPLTVSGVTGPVAQSLAAASGRPAVPCWPCPPGRSARSRRRRCAQDQRSRPGTRTATSAPARPGPSRTWTATGSGCSGTRSKPRAGARCCSRTPTSSGS